MSVTRAEHSVQELRQLIAQLERSGMAEQRPEVRALLDRSRALLRQRHPSTQQSSQHRMARKLGQLLTLAMDAALLGSLPFLFTLFLAGEAGRVAFSLALLAPLWLMFRLYRHAHWLAEGGRWVCYHLAWVWDWFAEAFSLHAMARLEMRSMAGEVMWGWRQHRRGLPRRPTLDDVRGFLTLEYGPQAAREFHRLVETVGHAQDWSQRGRPLRNRAADRLAALRWSALIMLFERLGTVGALWPDFVSDPDKSELPGIGIGIGSTAGAKLAAPSPAELEAEPPERAARRADLRDIIRRKRQDITAAFGWKLKTEAEIAQRDDYLAQTRAEIGQLEQELAKLGG